MKIIKTKNKKKRVKKNDAQKRNRAFEKTGQNGNKVKIWKRKFP